MEQLVTHFGKIEKDLKLVQKKNWKVAVTNVETKVQALFLWKCDWVVLSEEVKCFGDAETRKLAIGLVLDVCTRGRIVLKGI